MTGIVESHPTPLRGRSDRLVGRLTMAAFFLQPVAFGSWLPRIPDVQQALGLGPGTLALALLGLPAGTLVTLPFAGPLVGRIGARMALLSGFLLYSLAVLLPPLAPSPLWLFFALMVAGSAISFLELGLNVQADRVEKATGRTIMSTCHGFWSLGIMAGSLLGAGLAALHLSPLGGIASVAGVVLPIGLLIAWASPDFGADPHDSATGQKSAWSLPGAALIGICLFVFGVAMTEGAMADWSAVFLRDMLGARGGDAGLGYAIFAGFVAAGRFGGDHLKSRFGAASVARAAGLSALFGIAILVLAPALPLALFGFAIVGLGASVGFPLGVSAAASLTDRPASANVATLSFVALTGFLVGPPIIGFLAELTNLRVGLAGLLPFLALSLLLAGRLGPSRRD
jgi:MFS family permease